MAPVELCSGRPNCGATQSLAQAVESVRCLTDAGTLSFIVGNWSFGIPALDRSEPPPRQFCGRAKGQASSLTCTLQVALRGELLPLIVPPQLKRQP